MTAEWVTLAPWAKSPVPAEHQVRGLGPITLSVPELAPTDAVLTALMNMRKVREYPHPRSVAPIRRTSMRWGKAGLLPNCTSQYSGGLPIADEGAGGVHHVAFRTPDDVQYDAWATRLNDMRIPNTGKIDRFYFRSLYFREPNGILFEIATDGPGFATDEPADKLGETLSLPPFLEPKRARDRGGTDAALNFRRAGLRDLRLITGSIRHSQRGDPNDFQHVM